MFFKVIKYFIGKCNKERRTIRKEFDINFYLKQYPDVANSEIDPVTHFLLYGWEEGRWPRPDFDTQYYIDNNPDVTTSGMNPFFHYLVTGKAEGRSGLPASGMVLELNEANLWIRDILKDHFDAHFYREKNLDVAAAGHDPMIHYIEIGWKEGRNPTADFDVTFYLNIHQDVAAAGVEPFTHFISEGKLEGREASFSKKSANSDDKLFELSWQKEIVKLFFDKEYYLRANSDLRDDGIDPLTHYLAYGWKEKRDPSQEFSTDFYLQANPDVAAAEINPLVHYAASGRNEGRQIQHPGGYRAQILRQLKGVDERIKQWNINRVDKPENEECLREILESAVGNKLNAQIVVSFSHDDYLENTGGIQTCIREEQVLFNDAGHIYLHLCPDQPLPVFAPSGEGNWVGKLIVDGHPCSRFYAADLITQLAEVLAGRDAILIIHALHGHRPEWIESLYETIKPRSSYFWVHDYFSVCLGYNLLRNDICYCAAPELNSNGCQLCVYGDFREGHQRRIRSLFSTVSFTVVAPSQFALDLWKKKSKLPHAYAIAHEHRIFNALEQKDQGRADGPVHVAFLGLPAFCKGWFAFRELVQRFGDDDRYRFFHLGLNPDPCLDVEYVRVKFTPDEPEAMQHSIRENKIDVALILSNWPETFCLTAYEAIAGGAAIVTTNLSGNVAEMLRDRGQGLVLSCDNELNDCFESGVLIKAIDTARKEGVTFYDLISSGMTASLILDGERNHEREEKHAGT